MFTSEYLNEIRLSIQDFNASNYLDEETVAIISGDWVKSFFVGDKNPPIDNSVLLAPDGYSLKEGKIFNLNFIF
jgi:hypothetical protein